MVTLGAKDKKLYLQNQALSPGLLNLASSLVPRPLPVFHAMLQNRKLGMGLGTRLQYMRKAGNGNGPEDKASHNIIITYEGRTMRET